MKLNSEIERITKRISDRSDTSRAQYLARMEDNRVNKPARSKLSCGNLAHGMATCTSDDKKLFSAESVPNLAIVNAYNDMLSAHEPYQYYPQLIKQVAASKGVTAQVAGGVPAMCDGVTQGQAGMELSLFSRDLIAMATAISLSHDMFDGVMCLGVCDKIVPGLLIGALSFGHLPTVFLPAGPMTTGQSNSDKAKTRQLFAEGKVDRKALLMSEAASYHGPGTCTFYGTANSNQMLMEMMGLHLPGSSFVPPYTEMRDKLTEEAVIRLAEMSKKLYGPDRTSVNTLSSVISVKSIVNGIVGLLATGGSTNHAIHLVAIAKAAGIIIDWQDMAELSQVTPLLCRIYPNGSADINHFHAAGGMGFLMRELLHAGLLHNDVKTIMGEGLESYCLEPKFKSAPQTEIFRTGEVTEKRFDSVNSKDNETTKIKNNDTRQTKVRNTPIDWFPVIEKSLDESILRSADQPFASFGGLQLMSGNIGRSVIKVSAVAKEHQVIKAPAEVFESQEAFQAAFTAGQLEKDFIAVIRFQGPKTNGMPELHKLTPLLGVLQDKGFQVALITDGRMSGASGKVPAAIHMTPEASEGGIIAKIESGDLIEFDAVNGHLNVVLTDEALANRKSRERQNTEQAFGVGRELFEFFRDKVSGAEAGATIF